MEKHSGTIRRAGAVLAALALLTGLFPPGTAGAASDGEKGAGAALLSGGAALPETDFTSEIALPPEGAVPDGGTADLNGGTANLNGGTADLMADTYFTITFDSAGGTYVDSVTAAPGGTVRRPNNPVRSGWYFLGWFLNPDDVEPFDFSTQVHSDLTLTARWEEETNLSPAPEGLSAQPPAAPQGRGRILGTTEAMEYSLSPNFTVTFPCTEGETIGLPAGTYYVRYRRTSYTRASAAAMVVITGYGEVPVTYTVTFDSTGETAVESQILTAGERVRLPAPPLREGYVFDAWYTSGDLRTTWDFSAAVYADTTLYAGWKRDEPSGPAAAPTGLSGKAPTEEDGQDGQLIGTTAAMEYSAYPAFSAVFHCSDGVTEGLAAGTYYVRYSTAGDVPASAAAVVEVPAYGEETAANHAVTFDSAKGSAVEGQIVQDGKKAARPVDPVRDGYVFDDWYLDARAAAPYDFDAAVHGSFTLYARWISNTPSQPKPVTRGCYVATAVYGSYDCPEVWVLRRFRDDVLAESWYGRLFVRLYYAVSPAAVRLFGESGWFRDFFRARLDGMVDGLRARGFADTPYQDRDW